MKLRTAARRDLPAIIALLADEDHVVDPRSVEVDDAYEQAFKAVDADERNEMIVLDEGDGTVLGCLQLTCIPGLGRHGQERALIEAVRIRADRRGSGLGREALTWAIERARARGCSHDGFKLSL
ncbi:GNAT family N-acetyltransferase [Nonomuraea sp. SBT364]|uniref:GNAT family N-acetyltransferase n=1 Tax=Nonomuraea sp. SBT364 TaxID=1580530 RepID=UPI0012E0CAD4|nr:GNAT family N-acetyltransferase [Nonomuraea sp. SBT364]